MKISDIPRELEEIRTEGRFRKVRDLRMITASRGVDREGKEYIVFNSNDYLGMTHEKEVEEAAKNAIAATAIKYFFITIIYFISDVWTYNIKSPTICFVRDHF